MKKNGKKISQTNRRDFLKASLVMAAPLIVPSRVMGQNSPNSMIQVAQIGCGRIARASEMPGVLRHSDIARFTAVCDLDTVRIADGKEMIETAYAKKFGQDKYDAVKTYGDYREMLLDKEIDAVCISTPDHWHAQPAIEAALAGKDIYLQKPASLTIVEGRQMADTVKQTGRIFQQGSQQRSDNHFRLACELVRNGRIGKVKQVYIGLPVDPSGDEEPEMPVPANLNYDMWLGSTPMVYYTEKRAHPQSNDMRVRYDRPGWLRCEQFGAGMITGWGAHHIDIAHWAMGTEFTGPVALTALAQFPKSGLWDVHGSYHVRSDYLNGAAMYISDAYPNGIKFIGEDGWLWVTRGGYNPQAQGRSNVLDAHDPRILHSEIKENEVHLHKSPRNDHHLDWLTSIQTRNAPATSAEIGHRACTSCLLAHAAMRLGRPLKWDPEKEQFIKDEEANRLLARDQRAPYGTNAIVEKMKAKS